MFERYEAYKDSEVEWLGDVPEHWSLRRLKEILSIASGDGANLIDISFRPGLYPIYGGNGVMGYTDGFNNSKDILVIGRVGAKCGNVHYVNEKVWVSDNALVAKSKFNKFFLEYALNSLNLNRLSSANAQPLITGSLVKNQFITLPDKSEVTQITNYLDTKTKKIDRKIYLLSQKATHYGKLKQSLINETITRGLDKTVPMKDSEVKWIGEVPEHWETRRIADIAVQNKIKNNGLIEENLLSLSYGKIIRKNFNTSFGLLPESFETYQIVKAGTVILRLTDLQNDQRSLRVGLVHEQGIITSAYLGLQFHQSINSNFAYYLLHVYDLCKVFYWFGGGLRSTMRFDDIKVIPFILPPLAEQQAIAEYLDEKTAKIDQIITSINIQIDKLKELRKTLINDVVTGKIKVFDENKDKLTTDPVDYAIWKSGLDENVSIEANAS